MIIRKSPQSIAIPQVTHAELTARLARNLDFTEAGLDYPPEIWFQAVARHDDGWLLWDRCPEIDPESDTWYNFLDIPAATHLHIWKRSVVASEGIHPAVSWWISRHVVRLHDYHDWSAEGLYVRNQAREFKKRQLQLQDDLLPEVRKVPDYEALDELLAQCDWFSLVLCIGLQQAEIMPMFSGNNSALSLESRNEKVRIKHGKLMKVDLDFHLDAFKIPEDSSTSLMECEPVRLRWNITS